MVRRRSPFYLITDLHRGLANWWSAKVFAGSGEMPSRDRFFSSRFAPLFLLILACLLFYARLDCPLLEPEEARYAEIPRQMWAEGRWLTPVLHGEDYLQKPPLLYWLIMLSYQIFGVHDWAARLVPASAGVLTVLITYGWARCTVGPRSAFFSGVILSLSARYLYLGGMVNMDSLLCVFVIGGLAAAQIATILHSSFFVLHSSFFLFLSALCCGLGVMTKGPVTAVLIVVPLLLWRLLDRRCTRISPWGGLAYLGVVLIIAAPWYLAISWRDPQATTDFFWLHNIVRYFAPLDHEKPAWFYLPGLALGMLPWSLLLIPLVVYLKKKSARWARRRPASLGLFVISCPDNRLESAGQSLLVDRHCRPGGVVVGSQPFPATGLSPTFRTARRSV
jgi:4-amino-4-deoxy-L-arabinose transferase-like glycosyltransferase